MVNASVIDSVVMYTEYSSDSDSTEVGLAHVRWSTDRLVHGGAIGTVATFPTFASPRGTTFRLPSGDVIAAVLDGPTIHAARVTLDAAGIASIAERFTIDTGLSMSDGSATLSGAAVTNESWAFAGGGRSRFDTRPAFAAVTGGGEPVWSELMSGLPEDPPPLVAGTSPPTVVRWHQNPADLDDTSIVTGRIGVDGLIPRAQITTRGLSIPLDAHVGATAEGGFAVWSVRAQDDFSDALMRLVLFDPTEECAASEMISVARLVGAASAPSVHGIYTRGELLLFGLPTNADGEHELVAFRVRCDVEP